ncbi:MFS transporter [Streptodolium elevatio]
MPRIDSTGAGLAAMTVSFGLNFSAGVFFAPVAEDYGIGAGTLAVAAALSTAATGAAQPLVGVLLDRYGAKRVVVAALLLLSASYLALGAARGAGQFVVAYVVLGGLHVLRAASLVLAAAATDPRLLVAAAMLFGAASFTVIPLTMAAVTRGLDPARLGRTLAPAWTLHQGAAGLGLAAAAAGHAATGGYRAYFATGVGLSLLAAILTATPKATKATDANATTPVAANPNPTPTSVSPARTTVRTPASPS